MDGNQIPIKSYRDIMGGTSERSRGNKSYNNRTKINKLSMFGKQTSFASRVGEIHSLLFEATSGVYYYSYIKGCILWVTINRTKGAVL